MTGVQGGRLGNRSQILHLMMNIAERCGSSVTPQNASNFNLRETDEYITTKVSPARGTREGATESSRRRMSLDLTVAIRFTMCMHWCAWVFQDSAAACISCCAVFSLLVSHGGRVLYCVGVWWTTRRLGCWVRKNGTRHDDTVVGFDRLKDQTRIVFTHAKGMGEKHSVES